MYKKIQLKLLSLVYVREESEAESARWSQMWCDEMMIVTSYDVVDVALSNSDKSQKLRKTDEKLFNESPENLHSNLFKSYSCWADIIPSRTCRIVCVWQHFNIKLVKLVYHHHIRFDLFKLYLFFHFSHFSLCLWIMSKFKHEKVMEESKG